MPKRDLDNWMWSEACDMLARAERLQTQFFRLRERQRLPVWEPPADMLETEREILVLMALPGVDPDRVAAVIENGVLVVAGERILPPELRTAAIHRLELPQGRFERRLALPASRYESVTRGSANGCLVITLKKAAR
jgi:HSP20 family molecular chaperone IbpA